MANFIGAYSIGGCSFSVSPQYTTRFGFINLDPFWRCSIWQCIKQIFLCHCHIKVIMNGLWFWVPTAHWWTTMKLPIKVDLAWFFLIHVFSVIHFAHRWWCNPVFTTRIVVVDLFHFEFCLPNQSLQRALLFGMTPPTELATSACRTINRNETCESVTLYFFVRASLLEKLDKDHRVVNTTNAILCRWQVWMTRLCNFTTSDMIFDLVNRRHAGNNL